MNSSDRLHSRGVGVGALGRSDPWKITLKPSKSLASGQVAAAIFIDLPGNSVSAFDASWLFGASVTRRLQT